MKSYLALFSALLVVPFACRPGSATADATFTAPDVRLRTGTPVVAVAAHGAGRRFLDLPALEYAFDVEARCDDDWVPESLSLNVADSRVVLGASQLSDTEPAKVVLEVPARQLAPVPVHGFCLLEDDAADIASPLTIHSVLSAHASLLCRNDQQRRIAYVSQPLDIQLACTRRPELQTGDR